MGCADLGLGRELGEERLHVLLYGVSGMGGMHTLVLWPGGGKGADSVLGVLDKVAKANLSKNRQWGMLLV